MGPARQHAQFPLKKLADMGTGIRKKHIKAWDHGIFLPWGVNAICPRVLPACLALVKNAKMGPKLKKIIKCPEKLFFRCFMA
jgi:hypothetical protein